MNYFWMISTTKFCNASESLYCNLTVAVYLDLAIDSTKLKTTPLRETRDIFSNFSVQLKRDTTYKNDSVQSPTYSPVSRNPPKYNRKQNFSSIAPTTKCRSPNFLVFSALTCHS